MRVVKKIFQSLKKGFQKSALFTAKIKNKTKKGIIYILKRERVEKLKSHYLRLLSKQNKNLLHVGVLLGAMAIGGFNVLSSEEITVSAKDSSILVDLIFPEEDQYEVVKSDLKNERKKDKNYLSMISIASAAFVSGSINNQGVMASDAGAENQEGLNTLSDDTLVRTNPAETQGTTGENGSRVKKYKVQDGDTVSSIAKNFGIDGATILQENNLYADDIIKPGMQLSVLPTSGATERVDKGENLSAIAQKHNIDVEKIKDYNNILLATDIEEGQILVIPDGKREIKERPRPEQPKDTLLAQGNQGTRAVSAAPPTGTRSGRQVSSTPRYAANGFPWGYCTWYVASRRGDVTWHGNAGQWLRNAQAQGRATGRVPAVGSIMVTNESWWGHVAVVESVQGDKLTVSEMNYVGYGKVSRRTVSNSSRVIKGYIY